MNRITETARRLMPKNATRRWRWPSAGVDPLGELPRAAPTVWLLGKVQSGKSSIVRVITNSTQMQIGTGFKACTRTSQVFDFPAEAPILRFLDTRGLEEVSYDPSEDMALAERQANLLLVAMRALDLRQQPVIDAIRMVRHRHPDWPIVVAQTSLHEAYAPGAGHILPYPFRSTDDADLAAAPGLPQSLARSLASQRDLFAKLPGNGPIVFVPIDFTRDDDGFTPSDYGMEALSEALVRVAPQAIALALSTMALPARDKIASKANSIVLGHAMVAAGSDLVPVAGAVAVSAVQTRLLQQLGSIYGVAWDRRTMTEFATALGSGVIARTLAGFGVRQMVKLIPVYGQTVGAATSAAMSFAVTFALGKSAIYFLHRRSAGLEHTESVAAIYQQSLREALRLAKARKRSSSAVSPP